MRLDLTAAEHTNCPRRLSRLLLAAVLLLLLAINPDVFTLASPWTAPAWMKANGSYDNNGLAGSVLPRYYSALAQYFVSSSRPTRPAACRSTRSRR
jgi:O-glycosyl hydrolase